MNEQDKRSGWHSSGEWGRAKSMLIRELNMQLVKLEESDLPEQEKDRLRDQIENKIFSVKQQKIEANE